MANCWLIRDGVIDFPTTYTVTFFELEPSDELQLTDDDREFLVSIKVKV
jgi:hypothetical protein